jgi:HSP20 family protein
MLMEYAAGGRRPDLFREMRRAQEEMNRLFGRVRFPLKAEFPPLNVWAGADGALITAEVPGVRPDQIDVTVHQDTVTLSGKRDPEAVDSDAIVHRQERIHGAFARTVLLPFRVDADKVSAHCDRGVLILELPRHEADKPRKVKIAGA